ncbi:hypothetical protein [Halobacillus trueperi]|uniref:Uncharacterized protein n=1 Tax=Halobacillus trueperi TaxID=156205 RepID=A0A3E0J533_9BACI|nr:hypothetical protein [Halobacillus trueperi]REJ07971.1 hypothetical protein DYE48_15135 [Halobacillus trueperi]
MRYLAEKIQSVKGKHDLKIIRIFTDKEYENLILSQEIFEFHEFNKKTKEMVKKNGMELENFIEDYRNKKANEDDETKALWEANRLLLNFLASFSSYVDQSKKNIGKFYGEEKRKSWEALLSTFYDDHENFEYRFMSKLRNFISHYGFPLNYYIENDQGAFILMSKSNLLTFKDGWAKVKKDIEQIDQEYINIVPMVKKHRGNVDAIYLLLMVEYGEKLTKAIGSVNKIYKEVQSDFLLIEVEKEEDLKDPSKMSPESFSLETMYEALQDLKKHPSINIKVN